MEGRAVKNFRLSIIVAFCTSLNLFSIASAQSDAETSGPAASAPAFLTSMPSAPEPSLFESVITQKNDELEQRIHRLESQLNQGSQCVQDPGCAIEQRLLQQECGSGGLFGSIEVTFLKPYLSGAQTSFGFATGQLLDTTTKSDVRYILGYRTDSGLGIRGRYWSFDHNYEYAPPFAGSHLGIRLDVADLEVTTEQLLRRWNLGLSGGVRYGKLTYSNAGVTIFGPGTVTFEGVGPTVSLDARRGLGNTGLSFFGNVRGSVMVGSVRNGSILPFLPRGTIEQEVMTTFENQLGVAWNHCLPNNVMLQVRAAWETQYWMNSTLSDDVYGIGTNLTLMGPTLGVELRY
jgi:hypothetical protein